MRLELTTDGPSFMLSGSPFNTWAGMSSKVSYVPWGKAIIALKKKRVGFTVYNAFLKWCDIRPNMVTHTRNSCSAFNPSKCTHTAVNTHTHTHTHREHTPGAVGSVLCCSARGAVGGSVPCSTAPQSWYWRWRERCTFTPPTYNSYRPETRIHKLWISPTLTIRPRLPPTVCV